jgi:hypothetical protein
MLLQQLAILSEGLLHLVDRASFAWNGATKAVSPRTHSAKPLRNKPTCLEVELKQHA